jgi:hypothetical protein
MQEAARLMAAGDYEAALPVAMEAVALGEQLFKPQPALQLFPLYLLAAQVGRNTSAMTWCYSHRHVLQQRSNILRPAAGVQQLQ